MEKKNNVGLVVLVIIELLIILGLAGFVGYEKFIKKDFCKCNKCEVKKENKEDSILEDQNKKVVYDNKDYKYLNVPYINVKTEDGKRYNDEIKEFVKDYNDTKEASLDYMVSYKYSINKDVVSVIIKETTPASAIIYYKTINFDKNTGKEISNEEIIQNKKIDESEILDKMIKIYEEDVTKEGILEECQTMRSQDDEFTSVCDATKEKIKKVDLNESEIYLNEDGDLVVVFEIYYIAGAGRGNKLFNIDKNIYEK